MFISKFLQVLALEALRRVPISSWEGVAQQISRRKLRGRHLTAARRKLTYYRPELAWRLNIRRRRALNSTLLAIPLEHIFIWCNLYEVELTDDSDGRPWLPLANDEVIRKDKDARDERHPQLMKSSFPTVMKRLHWLPLFVFSLALIKIIFVISLFCVDLEKFHAY